jgi:hypothetical protein
VIYVLRVLYVANYQSKENGLFGLL